MSYPIVLPNGFVSIYGEGFALPTPNGMILETTWVYGVIDAVYDGGEIFVYGGDIVIFKSSDVTTRLAFDNAIHTIVPARLVTKESVAL